MSKAFTKEDESDFEEELPEDDDSSKLGIKVYLTRSGFERFKNELKHLLTTERPQVVEVVTWAASNGDRSENADYTYGKRRLREIDRRIRFLQKRLDVAEVVDPENQKGERVLFGATVNLANEDGETNVYSIVGVDEADAGRGLISWRSPLGSALLQAKVGDVVTVQLPRGVHEFEVLKIEFNQISINPFVPATANSTQRQS